MIALFKKHTLISIYTLMFLGLLYGVHYTSGFTYFPHLFIYIFSLIGFYFLLQLKFCKNILTQIISWLSGGGKYSLNIIYLVVFALLFLAFHFIYLGGSPAIKGLSMTEIEDVVMLRSSITQDAPKLIAYISEICLKSVLPFLLLFLLYTNRKMLYWLVLTVAVFYAFSMMQKSYIIGILVPVLLYCIVSKRFLYVLKYIALIITVVFGLSLIANPEPTVDVNELEKLEKTDPEYKEIQAQLNRPSIYYRVALGLYNRIMIVPGKVVTGWFESIPDKKPFLYGDGYRFIAVARGRAHINYAVELYPIIQPHFAAQGYKGTVNAASFMYEYANFGKAGLILSGFILALLIVILEIFYADHFMIKIALNTFPLLLLSSCALTTLLFSGGWGFTMLFYFLFLCNTKA